MPSIHCLHDLDTFPGFFFFVEVLGHQQIVGYQILPFWLIFRHIYLQSLSFPNSYFIFYLSEVNTYYLSLIRIDFPLSPPRVLTFFFFGPQDELKYRRKF